MTGHGWGGKGRSFVSINHEEVGEIYHDLDGLFVSENGLDFRTRNDFHLFSPNQFMTPEFSQLPSSTFHWYPCNQSSFNFFFTTNYFTSSDPHHDMLGGGCQVRVVIENMMGRMENLRTLISGFLGLVILVRWALVTMFLSWTTQTGCRIHRTYVSLIGSGEGRHTTHLLKCVPLLSTSQTDWKQSSDVLSDISFDIFLTYLLIYSSDISSDILSDISSDILSDIFLTYLLIYSSDISSDILSDISSDTLSDISSDISFHMLSDISSDILSDISKPKPNIHSFTQKAALQTLYLPHTTQQK